MCKTGLFSRKYFLLSMENMLFLVFFEVILEFSSITKVHR